MADHDTAAEDRSTTRLLLAGFLVYVFLAGFFQTTDPDIGFHIRTGELVLTSHAIPSVNTFSFTQPSEPWLLHQWAPGILFHEVWTHTGVTGLITFKALVGAAIFFVVVLASRVVASTTAGIYAATAAVLFARQRFFERPLLFSALFLAALVYATLRWKHRRAWLWAGFPLLMAVWANTHAGVIYGVIYAGCIVAADGLAVLHARWRGGPEVDTDFAPVVNAGGAFVAAVGFALLSVQVINPHGVSVVLLPLTYTLDPFWHSLIVEFLPPRWDGTQAFYIYLVVLAVLLAMTIQAVPRHTWLPAIVFAGLAMTSQRSILDFGIVSVPCAAACLGRLTRHAGERTARMAVLLLPVCWLCAAKLILIRDPRFVFGPGLHSALYPVGIYRFMDQQMEPQPLFNDMRYGGSILWFLYPRWRPFIDGRCEAYSRDFWKDVYLPAAIGLPAWRDIFARHDVHAALLNWVFGSPMKELAGQLATDTNWAVVAFTDRTILFLERTDANRPVIDRFEFHLVRPADPSFSAITPATAKEAMNESLRALEIDPRGALGQTALARSFVAESRFKEAASVYAALVETRDASGSYWRDYLFAVYMAGQPVDADRIAGAMLRKGKEPAFAWYIRSFVYEQRGDRVKALKAAHESARLDPRNPSYEERSRDLERHVAR